VFVPGQVYRRRDLHKQYGGQQQGGISTPSRFPFIVIFTGDSGEQYGYKDGWQENGIFYYTGEGQKGDMKMSSGNKAIAEHSAKGKDLYLFEQAQRSHVRYLGQFVATGSHFAKTLDVDRRERQAIVFELAPIEEFVEPLAKDEIAPPSGMTLGELRDLAIESSADASSALTRMSIWRKRSEAVRRYVLKRSNGACESCRQPAPFASISGEPYLEPHHIRRLSDGGPDHPRWVAAICPNCHRHVHYGIDGASLNARLADAIGLLEPLEPKDNNLFDSAVALNLV